MEYGELTSKEYIIFKTFKQLLQEIGRVHDFYFFNQTENNRGENRICIYKDINNKWISYVSERNQMCGYREYDNLYDLCLDSFESLEKKDTDYCLSVFPELVQNELDRQNIKTR